MFRTELTLSPAPFRIGLHTGILTAGSCFAETMGNEMKANKMSVCVNPFGTIFNPVSLCQLLCQTATQAPLPEKWVCQQGIWHHYDFHSSFHADSKAVLQKKLEATLDNTRLFLAKTDVLILTWGTAFSYALKETNTLVANCHKVPASQFTRHLLREEQMREAFDHMFLALSKICPNLQIILTVSPVRHTKDTLPLNGVSKSLLRVFSHQLTQQYQHVHYFPSYEMMLDDLRDYRFYKADMIHPSEVAEKYIWQKFSESYLDEDAKAFMTEWKDLQTAMAHKPRYPNSSSHGQFLRAVREKLARLSQTVNVQQEMAIVDQQLADGTAQGPD